MGWSDPALPLLFPDRLRGLLADAGPRSLSLPGSSSRELAPSSEFYPLEPARRLRAVRLPWGSFLLRDINPVSPLTGRHPSPAYVPSSAFLPLSTVYSSPDLASLFHPATASEVHSSGVSPDDQPHWLVTSRCPLAVSVARLHRASSMLQLAPPDSRALLRSPVRCRRRAV